MWYDNLLEKNQIPDIMLRQGIRYYNQQHLKRLAKEPPQQKDFLIAQLKDSPLAVSTDKANEQHYEVPAAFYQRVLGPRLKYSCGYWKSPSVSLAQSETDMLELYCQRAQLQSAHNVLELGCGWGSLTLYMARKYPHLKITAISNSASQKAFILDQAHQQGLKNIEIITVDINDFQPENRFDRLVSIEMFEHLRNYDRLFKNISQWLKPGGLLFCHIFTHKKHAYLFEVEHERDWMAKYFFTGGTMPSHDLLPRMSGELRLQQDWELSGQHYEKTSNAWLARMDAQKAEILPLMGEIYGKDQQLKWWVYWRVFFMACAELFGHDQGQQWQVSHYLFQNEAK